MYEGKRLYLKKEMAISAAERLSRVSLFEALRNKYFKYL